MNEKTPEEERQEEEGSQEEMSDEHATLNTLFASGEINKILKAVKVPTTPPVKIPDMAAVQQYRKNQKRVPPERVSHKKRRVYKVPRRSKPKGRQ